MQLRELMTRGAVCTRPDATLQEAAEQMKTRDVGSLPVCVNDQLVGMLTDRDITVRSVAEGHDPWTDRVSDAMTSEVSYCFRGSGCN
jgi:CBS domain-containing protein